MELFSFILQLQLLDLGQNNKLHWWMQRLCLCSDVESVKCRTGSDSFWNAVIRETVSVRWSVTYRKHTIRWPDRTLSFFCGFSQRSSACTGMLFFKSRQSWFQIEMRNYSIFNLLRKKLVERSYKIIVLLSIFFIVLSEQDVP